jgi:cell division protein FtsB
MTRRKAKPRSFGVERNQKQGSFISRLFKSQRFLAFIGLVLLVLISFPLLKAYSQKRAIEEEMAQIQAEIDYYEQETADLQEMIEYLGSKESLEAQARLNLNLKKPGETVVAIERDEISLQEQQKKSLEENKSNLRKWREYFFHSKL